MEQVNKLLHKVDTEVAYQFQLINSELYSEQILKLRDSIRVDLGLFELKMNLRNLLRLELNKQNESNSTRSKTI